MIIFLFAEIALIFAGVLIISGHVGLAGKVLAGVFFLILSAVVLYLIQLINNAKK